MELGEYTSAFDSYSKAAQYNENKQFTPLYLTKAAIAAENNGDKQKAIKTYSVIVEKYKKSSQYQDARKHKARLEASLAE